MYRLTAAVILSVLAIGSVRAEDSAMASAFADAGVEYVGKGNQTKAKDCFYKALAHDENCPVALYELAKIFEAEGDTVSAVNFFVKSAQELNKSADAKLKTKAQDCERRVQKLSPYASQFTTLMEGYAQDLGRIATKNTDAPTIQEAQSKVSALNLMTLVAPDKIPDVIKPSNKPVEQPKPVKRRPFMGEEPPAPEVKTVVPPDIERALKADGWTEITGVWKKKADGVYEVTDGKLECKKTNGAVQCFVHKGGTGSVAVLVRAANNNGFSSSDFADTTSPNSGFFSRWCKGFGYVFKGGDAKLYTPIGWQEGDIYMPDLEKTVNLTDIPKHRVLINVQDSKLDISLDTGSPRHTTYKITKDGPFVIAIQGTMTIESPKAAGN